MAPRGFASLISSATATAAQITAAVDVTIGAVKKYSALTTAFAVQPTRTVTAIGSAAAGFLRASVASCHAIAVRTPSRTVMVTLNPRLEFPVGAVETHHRKTVGLHGVDDDSFIGAVGDARDRSHRMA
jgi:hypothetical protein